MRTQLAAGWVVPRRSTNSRTSYFAFSKSVICREDAESMSRKQFYLTAHGFDRQPVFLFCKARVIVRRATESE